ncbi:DUF3800 domain-containing protein [Sphingomonas sp. HF-S4]|uniref:DUF3800 domain-containing protein n=1 Tax=Sphingomonas agrestis TaxID=3080540 RepID=A0ABU3YDI8_9SPHN|nr:DUF3800 domain-containing protein [Sphingomonas sp. HF-S4]MDV3459232.1 DUF3800 domain-containing protein [Sphingomonas sp. HF-S4]
MFAYVDEAGNTGKNLFDPAQPVFSTLAVLTLDDFDVVKTADMAALLADIGATELHACELGQAGVETIAARLFSILKSARARFAVAHVEKRYLLATKIFDALFDHGENLAAYAHIYRIRPLRLWMVFNLAELIPDALARRFWDAMMAKGARAAEQGLVEFCDEVAALASAQPDKRMAEIVGNVMRWARDNPEAIYFHSAGKLGRQGHMPNTVGFGNLMDGIEAQARSWGASIDLIRHDEQDEFAKALAFWHEYFSTASPEAVEVTLGEKFVMQKGYGSRLEMVESSRSPGIQVADLLLWLHNRALAGQPLGSQSWRLLNWMRKKSAESDFSFDGVGDAMDRNFGWMIANDPPPGQMAKAQRLIDEMEAIRGGRVLGYAEQKSLPHMDDATSRGVQPEK